MIHFKMVPVIFFVMVFSSCHLIAKDKRAENETGEKTATRGLAAAGEPLHQICAKGLRTRHYDGESSEFLEIVSGKAYQPSRILTGSECVWVRESEFEQLGIRLVKMIRLHRPLKTDQNSGDRSGNFTVYIQWVCVNHYCSPRSYVVRPTGSLANRMAGETIYTIPHPNLPKDYMYPHSPLPRR